MQYNAARKIILNGVDGIIFVANSSRDEKENNIQSYKNMIENLKEYNLNLNHIPIVLQYNKRDLMML